VANVTGANIFSASGFPVSFDADKDLWYADIVFNAPTTWSPFVRLALARFQPDSLTDCELSKVVMADFYQLANERIATVRPWSAPGSLRVQVTGPARGKSSLSRLDPPTPVRAEWLPQLMAVVESRPIGAPDMYIADDRGELGEAWLWEGSAVTMVGTVDSTGRGTWTADIMAPVAEAGREFRLLIYEGEQLAAEKVSGGQIVRDNDTVRPAYMDMIPLSYWLR
jgi:hypothetical protein